MCTASAAAVAAAVAAERLLYERLDEQSALSSARLQCEPHTASCVGACRCCRLLAGQILEALEYYGISPRRQQEQELLSEEPRIGLLLPVSPISIAALAAVAAIGGVAVPLPFPDAAVAAETAAAAAAAAGGVAAAGGAVARPLAAAREEAGGEVFITRANAFNSSLLATSKSLRLLQQQLAETRVQLLLVHPALAAAAQYLCHQLGMHACICSAKALTATDACFSQQQRAASAPARLFVMRGPLYTRSLAVRTKWLPIRSLRGESTENLRELREALAAGGVGNSESSSVSSSVSSSASGRVSENSYALLLDASRCWGMPRTVILSASALRQQLQRNAEQLFSKLRPGDAAVVAAAPEAVVKSKLLLAVVLPLLRRRASVLLLTRQQREAMPLPLRVALQQQPADAAAKALAAELPEARAGAVWKLLLQQYKQEQQQQIPTTLVMDLETAEAMQALYERAAAAATAGAAEEATFEAPSPAAELAAAAHRIIRCCCVCTDESDLISRIEQVPVELRGSGESGSVSEGPFTSQARPAARIAAVVKWLQRLLPATAEVQHAFSVAEVGVVAFQKEKGLATEAAEQASYLAKEAAAAAEAEEGVFVGHQMPGTKAEVGDGGVLLFSSNCSSSGYFGRRVATAEAFGSPKGQFNSFFRSAILGEVGPSGEIRVQGSAFSAEPHVQRPLQQRLQQWQWGLPRMERLIEGYVHKVPITGREWGNYHAKKRHWRRIF
ncbi:uncharacterized protein LOC34619736 [Cyclospora cayetanensis]|uniref:Uncharacterized protein LOC34619736 n=1 Tax=Cyclospora cayetanensis TaxID=88456 RepID=A0A6P6S3E3_9EIME|nr:uncharacterized protein LOC34619736 [Cyclospora cayetanensis]